MKYKLSAIIILIFSTLLTNTNAQNLPTVKVDGSEVLVGAEGTLPLWLKSGQTLEIGDNIQYISVLEFNKEPLQGGGNSLVFEDVVIVTTPAATVPNGKVWKVESSGMNKNTTLASSLITQGNSCEAPSNIQIVRNGNKTITVSWNAPNNPPAYGYLIAIMPSGIGPTSSNDFITVTGTTTYTTGNYSKSLESFGLTDDIDVYIVSSCNLGSQSDPISSNVSLNCQYDQLYEFANCNTAGRTGPTQNSCNSAYSGTTLAGNVTVTSGIQQWTVPTTGLYHFEVAGASANAGKGAVINATLYLNQNDVLKILVGHKGPNEYGGGGGTFVALSDNTPLIVAGGGGGRDYHINADGTTKTSGNISQGGTIGGDHGQGGQGSWGGGGGFYTNGAGSGSGGGTSFLNGGIGGSYTHDGGFGGGGAGVGSTPFAGGGGGGYSGGGGGTSSPGRGGGGGGSYISASATNISTSDGNYNNSNNHNGAAIYNLAKFNGDHGYVKISSIICQ